MKIFCTLFFLLIAPNFISFHEDKILKLDKDNNIIGLPKEFGQSKFDLEKKYLKICDSEIIFPECIGLYFEILEDPKIQLSASWYHSKEYLPSYLSIKIQSEIKDYSYSLLINLETLDLLGAHITIKKGNTFYAHSIDLSEHCLLDYSKSIKPSDT